MPTGLVEQWGAATLVAGIYTLTFPYAFPTGCKSITATIVGQTAVGTFGVIAANTASTTKVVFYGNTGATYVFNWQAKGY